MHVKVVTELPSNRNPSLYDLSVTLPPTLQSNDYDLFLHTPALLIHISPHAK